MPTWRWTRWPTRWPTWWPIWWLTKQQQQKILADMLLHTVADMKVHMVANTEEDMVADMVADKNIFFLFLG